MLIATNAGRDVLFSLVLQAFTLDIGEVLVEIEVVVGTIFYNPTIRFLNKHKIFIEKCPPLIVFNGLRLEDWKWISS